MSYGFERLKEIGISKIHKDTHISMVNLKYILNEEFDKINKVQFYGFMSILEREYDLDLSGLKSDTLEHYSKTSKMIEDVDENMFVATSTKKSRYKKTIISFVISVLVLIVAVVAIFTYLKNRNIDSSNTAIELNKSTLKQKKTEHILPTVVEEKKELIKEPKVQKEVVTIADKLEQQEQLKENVIKEIYSDADPKAVINDVIIVPKSRVWIGYINLTVGTKNQKTTSKPIKLVGEDEFLFIFGHGNVDIKVDEDTFSFDERKSLRLHYKDGVVEKITLEEFKKLNNGRKW